MDRLQDILMWVLIPVAILLAICGVSLVVAYWLQAFFGISIANFP